MTAATSRARRTPPAHFDRRLAPPLLLGSVLNPINSTMLAVALVPIGTALGEPPSRTAWLVSALYLTTAIGQPVVGRLVDLFGPRRLYLVATALVGVAGVIGLERTVPRLADRVPCGARAGDVRSVPGGDVPAAQRGRAHR